MSAPPRPPATTAEQRQAGLAKATAANAERARIRTRLKTGDTTLAAVLENTAAHPGHPAGTIRLASLLKNIPHVGPSRTERILTEANVPGTKRLRGLGPRQRHAVIHAAGSR